MHREPSGRNLALHHQKIRGDGGKPLQVKTKPYSETVHVLVPQNGAGKQDVGHSEAAGVGWSRVAPVKCWCQEDGRRSVWSSIFTLSFLERRNEARLSEETDSSSLVELRRGFRPRGDGRLFSEQGDNANRSSSKSFRGAGRDGQHHCLLMLHVSKREFQHTLRARVAR